MAYQIKKDNEVVEELEFLDKNNEVVKKISVKINIDKIHPSTRMAPIQTTRMCSRCLKPQNKPLKNPT